MCLKSNSMCTLLQWFSVALDTHLILMCPRPNWMNEADHHRPLFSILCQLHTWCLYSVVFTQLVEFPWWGGRRKNILKWFIYWAKNVAPSLKAHSRWSFVPIFHPILLSALWLFKTLAGLYHWAFHAHAMVWRASCWVWYWEIQWSNKD